MKTIIIKHIICLAILFLFANHTCAEIIDGPANIREKPNGKLIAVLNDGVEVEMVPPYISAGSWFSISFVAYVEKESFFDSRRKTKLKGQRFLYDKQGKVIGKTIQTFKIGWDLPEINGRIGVVIEDYFVYKDNIRANTIPEYELSILIDAKKTAVMVSDIKSFITKYDFRKSRLMKDKDLESYYIYESSIYDPSPMSRINLIFYKNRLILVIHRNLPVSATFKSKKLFREMKTTYLEKVDDRLSKKINEEIIEPLKYAD